MTQRRIPTPSPELLHTLDLAARLLSYANRTGSEAPPPPKRRLAHLRLVAVKPPPEPLKEE